MNAIAPRGWCPTLFDPMPTGDGLLVRVRPPGAVLGAVAARALADAASRYGNGAIELTGRAGLQVRGLAADGVAPFARAMVAAGLANPDPAAERRRVVIAPPLADLDPTASPHAHRVAVAVEAALAAARGLDGLPAKFVVSVDAGGLLPLAGMRADIRVTCAGDACRIEADGLPACGSDPDGVASAVLRLAIGWSRQSRPSPPPAAKRAPRVVGAHPEARAFGVGLPFGATTAAVLAGLAAFAEGCGDGALRLTPWRALVLAGVADGAIATTAAGLGLIVDPADPRLRVTACVGAPGCAAATVDTRGAAATLAALGPAGEVHVSGCAKGCAHPGPAWLTLVGEAARFGVVHDGRAGDAARAHGLTVADIAGRLGGAGAR